MAVNFDKEKMKKRSIEALDSLIDGIVIDNLTDGEKVEFFDTYENDIIKMLEQKKKDVEKI